ncbi:hypothetical protein ACFZB2_15400 [Streptomyces bobili]|uniref:hypothetical protein n=1 Tax=Streptomyces bobili TaxID=67280 RepID=UPI0036E81C10
MLRTRIAQAAAIAFLVAVASLAAPAIASLSEADPFPVVVADAGWQIAPADAGWQ